MLYMCMLRVNHIKYYTVNDNNKIIAYTFSAKTFTTGRAREAAHHTTAVQAIATTITKKTAPSPRAAASTVLRRVLKLKQQGVSK